MSRKFSYDPRDDDPKPQEYRPYVEKQTDAEYLESHGIIPAKDKAGNRNMVLFTRKGNLTMGDNVPHRIEIVKQAQAKWLGKRVRDTRTGDTGTVTAVSFRQPDRVVEVKKYRREHGKRYVVSPYELGVSWDDKITRGRTSVYAVEILADQPSGDKAEEKS